MNLDTYLTVVETAVSFAQRLNVPPPLLSQWRNGVRAVPAERCPAIERLTDGQVACETLRPDVDWAYLRSAPPIQKAAA